MLVPVGTITATERVPFPRLRSSWRPGCHSLKSPTTLHRPGACARGRAKVTLTVPALGVSRIIGFLLVSLSNGESVTEVAVPTALPRGADLLRQGELRGAGPR